MMNSTVKSKETIGMFVEGVTKLVKIVTELLCHLMAADVKISNLKIQYHVSLLARLVAKLPRSSTTVEAAEAEAEAEEEEDLFNFFKLTGGWETCEEEGWCYVRYSYEENPKCKDQDWYEGSDEYSPNPGSDVGTKSYIWLTNQTNVDWEGLGKSKQACKGVKKYSTGNEEVLKEVKINSDFLLSENDEKIMLPLIGPDYDDWIKSDAFTEYTKWLKTTNIDEQSLYRLCHYQCYVRNQPNMVCSAWSFDTINSICHLHKVGACCGQRDKQEDDISFISGYICPHCWSTRKDCPCGIETLAQSSGTAHRGPGGGGPGYGVNSLSG